jgi:hypothetical protein
MRNISFVLVHDFFFKYIFRFHFSATGRCIELDIGDIVELGGVSQHPGAIMPCDKAAMGRLKRPFDNRSCAWRRCR